MGCFGNGGKRRKASLGFSPVPLGAVWVFTKHLFLAFLHPWTDTWVCAHSAPTGWAWEEQEEAPAAPHAGKKRKKYLHLPLIILQLSGPSWSTTTCLLTVLPCHVYQNSFLNHSHRANKGPGAYGGTEMLNSMLIYLWLLQPTVTTSNNWIVLSIARLICYLIIKPGPLLIMASLETRRSGEKCIQGAMLMLKTHMALGAEQDLCQMQMLYWWLIKHALCGLLCL